MRADERAGQKWECWEERLVVEYLNLGLDALELAYCTGRSVGAIVSRLARLRAIRYDRETGSYYRLWHRIPEELQEALRDEPVHQVSTHERRVRLHLHP